MSTTYSIGCRQCQKHLWVAQAAGGTQTLYTGQPETMEAMKTFLFEHAGHHLVFGENCEGEIGDWEEIEAPEHPAYSGRRYDGKPFIVTIDRSTMERGYVLQTIVGDGSIRDKNKPLKRADFEKRFGFSPEWPHDKVTPVDDTKPQQEGN